ncbi:hypothetical protein SAMD00019534_049620 [Acytostelium subglobosum LB1]|uniref:hypothetical protein n=1 Tax=Acytostelium subglobosum LB1 TaxID=1410327 RepID=UPI0006450688|nr:hypothetical protein SAMD00019534_049620 [Acytostelium subglobosum LB1]GAM21787.1 hypothetical protein SAMD00019534_049620 [Acytostelium subglobosum LB1]|eukprot:XP_012754887.1 hypothetical protein SAMD00019534_049620 [Acytostelium subglobosum LB1]
MSSDTVYRLHESLQIAAIYPPYIMVGWSWGSIDVQNFVLSYMDEVVGMMTLDGTDSGYAFDPANPPTASYATGLVENFLQLPTAVLQGAADAGQIPLVFGYFQPSDNLPATAKSASNQWYVTSKTLTTILQELQIMIPSANVLNSTYISKGTSKPLSNMPFVALTADANGADWISRQNTLVSLSSNSIHLHTNASHFIPLEEPRWSCQCLQAAA